MRRAFRWTEEAERLAKSHAHLGNNGNHSKSLTCLANKLVSLTGNPRDACLRFLHRHGLVHKREYRLWTKREQQRLIDLLETCPIAEVARTLQRSPLSIRSMLQRLGETAQRGREWFTIYSLAEVLHVRATEVQRWIDDGWLTCRIVETTGIKKRIIDPEDFSHFARAYGPRVVGRRLSPEGLRFVQTFVFPPKHAHLLPLRKRQATPGAEQDEPDLEETALDRIA